MNHMRLNALMGSALCGLTSGAVSGQCRYEVTAIIRGKACPFESRAVITPYAITEAHHIAGSYRCPGGRSQAFIWRGGEPIVDLPMPGNTTESWAFDAIEDGRIVGRVAVDEDGVNSVGFIFDGIKTETLEILDGHDTSEALAINADGTIVGESKNMSTGPIAAVVWQDGELTNLAPTLGTPHSSADDINDHGYVVGWRGSNRIHDARGFLLNLATGKVVDVGVVPNGSSGRPTAVNNRQVVVGDGWRPDIKTTLSFLWSSGQTTELGVLPGKDTTRVHDVNDRGLAVGQCTLSGNAGVAFLWHDGTLVDLNDLLAEPQGLTLSNARSINNDGVIACWATEGTHEVAVILSPVDPPVGDISGDCRVDIDDLLMLLSRWGSCCDCFEDLNEDGEVNFGDLLLLLGSWG